MAPFARIGSDCSGLLWAFGWIAAIYRRRGGASGEAGGGEAPFVGVGTGRGEGEFDAPRADADEGGELEELEPDRAARGLGELRVREAMRLTAQRRT